MSNDRKYVVLVADDEPSTLALLGRHLRARGYTVLEANDGDEAWELAHEHLPHLVILDVMMPGMSGWEVCRKIREAVSLAHTGVIMLTGIGEALNEMTSPLYGADAHVDKPFEFADLDAKIEQTLEQRQAGTLGRPDAADEIRLQVRPRASEDEKTVKLPLPRTVGAKKAPARSESDAPSAEAKTVAKTKPIVKAKPVAKAKPEAKAKSAPIAKAKPVAKTKAAAVAKEKSAPAAKAKTAAKVTAKPIAKGKPASPTKPLAVAKAKPKAAKPKAAKPKPKPNVTSKPIVKAPAVAQAKPKAKSKPVVQASKVKVKAKAKAAAPSKSKAKASVKKPAGAVASKSAKSSQPTKAKAKAKPVKASKGPTPAAPAAKGKRGKAR